MCHFLCILKVGEKDLRKTAMLKGCAGVHINGQCCLNLKPKTIEKVASVETYGRAKEFTTYCNTYSAFLPENMFILTISPWSRGNKGVEKFNDMKGKLVVELMLELCKPPSN